MKAHMLVPRLIAVLTLLALPLFAWSSVQLAYESGGAWALILEVEEGNATASEALKRTLIDKYGYSPDRVVHLVGEAANTDETQRAFGDIYDRLQPGDTLLVHISAPIVREGDGVFYYLDDSLMDAPWTWLDVRDLVYWMEALPVGSALMTYPSCWGRGTRQAREDYTLDPLRYGKRGRAAYEVFHVCDVEALRAQRDGPVLVPTAERRLLFTETLVATLRAEAQGSVGSMSAGVVHKALAERLYEARIAIELERMPEYADAVFVFQPTPSQIAPYTEAFDREADYGQLEKAMLRLIYASQNEPEALGGSAIEFFEGVALSATASVAAGRLADKEVERLRLLAVEGLNQLAATDAARTALARVATEAEGNPEFRRSALTRLAALRPARAADVAAVREAITDPSPTVRVAAVRSAVNLVDTASAPVMAARLEDPDETDAVKIAAVGGLSLIGGAEYRNVIASALGSDSLELRKTAASSIGRLGPSEAATVALIERFNSDPEEEVRASAALALARTATEAQTREVMSALMRAIRRGDGEDVRYAAIWALGAMSAPNARVDRTLTSVVRNANNSDALRIAAVDSLGNRGVGSAVPDLARIAEDGSSELRIAAVLALGQVGGTAAAEAVLSHVRDNHPGVREAAAVALDQIRAPTAVLLSGLRDPDARTRVEATRGLCDARSQEALDALMGPLGDDTAEVRAAAVDALACYGEDAAAPLIDILADGSGLQRQGAAAALGPLIDRDDVAKALIEATRDQEARVRAGAAAALANRGDRMAREALLVAVEDGYPEVRSNAVNALSSAIDDPVISALMEQLARTDPSPDVRNAAIRAINASTYQFKRR